MIYRYKRKHSRYTKDYSTLEEALKEFPKLSDDDNPDEFGEIFLFEDNADKPSMKYLLNDKVWLLL